MTPQIERRRDRSPPSPLFVSTILALICAVLGTAILFGVGMRIGALLDHLP